MEITTNNNTFFNELNRIKNYEMKANNTRTESVTNTYQNIPQFQQVENLSRNYARKGQQKFEDPFAFHQKPLPTKENGRNLDILNTLKFNQNKDHPELITINPLKVAGFY